MKKLARALAPMAALIFSGSGHAGDFEFQTYSNETPTTTTQGGQANEFRKQLVPVRRAAHLQHFQYARLESE